jgi:hypothetical protein
MKILKKLSFSNIYQKQLSLMPEELKQFAVYRFEKMKNYPLHEICKKLNIDNLVGYKYTLQVRKDLNLPVGNKKQSREIYNN